MVTAAQATDVLKSISKPQKNVPFFEKCFEILATLGGKVQVSCPNNRPLVMLNCVNICFKHHKKVMHGYIIKNYLSSFFQVCAGLL